VCVCINSTVKPCLSDLCVCGYHFIWFSVATDSSAVKEKCVTLITVYKLKISEKTAVGVSVTLF